MNKYRSVFLMLVILTVVITVGYGQNSKNSLNDTHIKIKLEGGSVFEAVHSLSRAGVPIGFEAREDLNVDSDPRIYLRDGKVKDVLNSLVSQVPSYTWEINDGVVNIFPIAGRSQFIASFLKTTINRIHVSSGGKRISIVSQFRNSLGIKTFHENWEGSKVSVFQSSVLGLKDTVSREIIISSADARTVLNKLTSSGIGSNIWQISVDCDSKIITISF